MSVDRITAGLRARERETAGSVIPLSNLRGAPRTISDLNTLASTADLKSKRLTEMVAGISTALESFEAEKRAELSEMGKSRGDNGTVQDLIGDKARVRMLRDAMRAKRKEALAVGSEAREKLAAELREIRAKVAAVSDLFSDSVAYLKTSTMGSDRRGAYLRDLQSSGPMEIEAALRHAVLNQDRDMAAAALQRLDSLPKNLRDSVRVNRREVADALVGAEVTRARRNMLAAEIAVESADIEVTRSEGREVPSSRKVALGIKRRTFEELNAAVEAENAAA